MVILLGNVSNSGYRCRHVVGLRGNLGRDEGQAGCKISRELILFCPFSRGDIFALTMEEMEKVRFIHKEFEKLKFKHKSPEAQKYQNIGLWNSR